MERQRDHRPPPHHHHDTSLPQHYDTTSSPAASLIQSVARSALLDEATPNSTVMSDDASDNMYAPHHHSPLDHHHHPLQSLQTSILPALPEEQDRRRFIGCLAAVLASSYDYDTEDVVQDNNNNPNESVWLGYPDDFWEEDDEVDVPPPPDSLDEKHQMLHKSQSTSSDSFYSTRCQSFESFGTQEGSTKTTQSARKFQSRRRRQTESYVQRSRRTSSNIFDRGDTEKALLSRERHRHRRYEVLSNLLMSSSELLLLDKTVARAFLPMLSRVLVPECRQLQQKESEEQFELPPRAPLTRNVSRSAPSSPMLQSRSKLKAADLNSSFDLSSSTATTVTETTATAASFRHSKQQSSCENVPQPSTTGCSDQPLPPVPLDNQDELRPFLESLTPGAGFRCVALLLLQYLLTSQVGYDARIRHCLRKLSVVVLMHDMQSDPVERHFERQPDRNNDMMLRATRKFEALEHSLAKRLIRLSAPGHQQAGARQQQHSKKVTTTRTSTVSTNNMGITREQIVRGVKIGGAGLVAGTLFAVTGGLAAPGIAAGVAAVAGAAAGTAAVATLTSAAVVTTIFGVGGGGLAAYKMQRRTQGVTEFEFYKETGKDKYNKNNNGGSGGIDEGIEAELFSTIVISGWMRDQCCFQRPWGLQPSSPKIYDRQELLERFYSIHSPEHLPKVTKILESWKGEEQELWNILREKYGCDPDHLFPLADGPRNDGALTLEQEEIVEKLFVELGYNSVAPERERWSSVSTFETMKNGWGSKLGARFLSQHQHGPVQNGHLDSVHGPATAQNSLAASDSFASRKSSMEEDNPFERPKHLDTVWDWKATYGGELYHVKWESELLKRICDCFIDLAMEVVTGAARQLLKQTVLHTLLAAVVWPSYLLNAADLIDGDWTLAVERADEAGKVLAKTLLFSRAGRRPVTLVGYSFGARIIYSCLKELARYQEEWETCQDMLEARDNGGRYDATRLLKYQKKMKGMREPASIVEDAILMGLPNHLSLPSWRACRQVVSGRLVNCYSTKDLILSLMFQAKRFSGGSFHGVGSILKPVCGTCKVNEPGIENVDCSDLILGHQDYCMRTGKILERIRFGQPMRTENREIATNVAVAPQAVTIGYDHSDTARRLDFDTYRTRKATTVLRG